MNKHQINELFDRPYYIILPIEPIFISQSVSGCMIECDSASVASAALDLICLVSV